MRCGFGVILCLAAFSPIAIAQTVDTAKLRQAIELPGLNASYGVNYKSSERDGKGNRYDFAQRIADLQKKLTGAPDDAEVYLDLRKAYLQAFGDEKKAEQMVAKAEAILRPFVQTADPKQAYLVTYYGTVLEIMADNPWADCEKWARRAVSVAPQDWRTWAYLAHARHQQIPIVLYKGDDKHPAQERRTQEIIRALHLHRFHEDRVNEAEKVLNEALGYHDKAKQLAPSDPKRQERRYAFRLTEIILRNAIDVYRGQKPAYPKMRLERLLLGELQECARLYPDHLLWQSQLAHQLIVVGWQEHGDKGGKTPTEFHPARSEDLSTIRQALANIEKLADAAQGNRPLIAIPCSRP